MNEKDLKSGRPAKNVIADPAPRPEKPRELRICFVLPSFNREKTIGSALEQITRQIQESQYRAYFSVLISENHSVDRSAEIARSFARRYDFIRIVSPPQHLPTAEQNLFFALRNVDADFMWPFGDDDLLLPGAVDWIYERVAASDAEFILINSQYQDSDGRVLRDRILETKEEAVFFDSFSEVFTEVGPLTLLASFSSALYRPDRLSALDLEGFIGRCPIYAHVFAYAEAFVKSRVEVLSVPLVVLRRTTHTAHWEQVARKFDWPMYFPWTGSLARRLLRARANGAVTKEQYGFALNSNENGRYGLIANILTTFMLQLLRAIEIGDPREVPDKADFADIRALVQDQPYVTVETLALLLWGEKNFADVCALLAPEGSPLALEPSKMRDALHTLGFGKDPAFREKVREKLQDRLHAVERSYMNFGTMSSEGRPYLFMGGRRYVIFRLASRFVLMARSIYEEDWRLMHPNRLDPADRVPDWFIFPTFEAALPRYFEFEYSGRVDEAEADDRVIFKIARMPPWNALFEVIETEDVRAFLEALQHTPEVREVLETVRLVLGQSAEEKDRPVDVFRIDSTEGGFINPGWYRETYSPRTQGMERELLKQSPLIHYIMIGSRKGWSVSPFFDEFFFASATKKAGKAGGSETGTLMNRVGLSKYFLAGGQSDVAAHFSVAFYREQCRTHGLNPTGSLMVHYLTTGIKLGLAPHPDWDEITYLDTNRDVKLAAGGAPFFGWVHWCTHGHFENRQGGFIKRGR